ncbi:MAG TPA: hypothetical protein VGE10_02820 [Zeimonas sp.]
MPRTAIERLGVALILAIPLTIVALYWWLFVAPLQTPSRTARMPGAAQLSAQARRPSEAAVDIERLADRLAQRLEREPGDANGWRTLARTYYVMMRFPEAVAAYEKLEALGSLDADVLADYADAVAMAQGRRLEGRPMQLVRRALDANPGQWKALSIAATDAFQRGDVRAAIDAWQRALGALPADSGMADSIRSSLAQARKSLQAGGAGGAIGENDAGR